MKTVMAWSGGKDSAVALWRLQQRPGWEVVGILTTVTGEYDRISMHGVRRALLEAQAAALGLTLHRVDIPPRCPDTEYEAIMAAALAGLREAGVEAIGFGDLFLEDIRAYRERMLSGTGLVPVFPVWGEETGGFARGLMAAGFRATLCCVDPRALDGRFAGSAYDAELLPRLPAGVDPCGENGEFHTFVHDGPNFESPVHFARGPVVEREGFVFADLIPEAQI